jgi:hypothetical protein
VHFERLAIEAGDDTFTLDFHERLTVIAGVGRLERDGLITELVGALGNGRSGVHLELASDAGTRYAVFRPVGAPHRVVDIDRAEDVTSAFSDPTGRVNLLQRAGLDDRAATRAMRVSAADLATRTRRDHYVSSLAHIEPGRLWDVASKVRDREERLNAAAEQVGSTPEDAEAYQLIEARHAEFEAAQAEAERVRHISFLVAAGAAVLAIPGSMFLGPYIALPLLVAAAITGLYSTMYWGRLADARRREEKALAAVGANSYMSFQINRVNGLIASDHHRRELMQAAEDHRAAVVEWQVLAGDVPVDWALEHRADIVRAHRELRSSLGVNTAMATTLTPMDDTFADLSEALGARLAATRTLGAGGESFPTFLDDPLVGAEPATKTQLLEQLVKSSADQQIIYLTNDEDIASWARVERLTEQVSIVEPGGSQAARGRTGGDDHRARRARHVAA